MTCECNFQNDFFSFSIFPFFLFYFLQQILLKTGQVVAGLAGNSGVVIEEEFRKFSRMVWFWFIFLTYNMKMNMFQGKLPYKDIDTEFHFFFSWLGVGERVVSGVIHMACGTNILKLCNTCFSFCYIHFIFIYWV